MAPKYPGLFFQPLAGVLFNRLLSVEESQWKAQRELRDRFNYVKLALTQAFKDAIPDAYHTGATGMGQQGFGNLTPAQILACLMERYGKPSVPELKKALLRLHEPMDCTAPVEVMLCKMEEIQMFLLANPSALNAAYHVRPDQADKHGTVLKSN